MESCVPIPSHSSNRICLGVYISSITEFLSFTSSGAYCHTNRTYVYNLVLPGGGDTHLSSMEKYWLLEINL